MAEPGRGGFSFSTPVPLSEKSHATGEPGRDMTCAGTYRVFHQLADLGWVDLDLGYIPHFAQLPSHFCRNPYCLSRFWQIAEQPI